jgi:hypothetical protein
VVTAADTKKLHTQWVAIETEKQERRKSEPYEQHMTTKAWAHEERKKVKAEWGQVMQARKVAKNTLNSDAATTSTSTSAPNPLGVVHEEEVEENNEESEDEGSVFECMSADSVGRAKVACPVMGCAVLTCMSCDDPRNILHDGEMMTIKDGGIYFGREHTDVPDVELKEETTEEQIASLKQWVEQQTEPGEWQTEVDTAEMRDAYNAVFSEGETENQIRAWEEEDAAVNGGFDRTARATDCVVVDQKEAKMAANVQKMEQMAAEARIRSRASRRVMDWLARVTSHNHLRSQSTKGARARVADARVAKAR